MTADDGLALAAFQLPGFRVVVGPDRSRLEPIRPIPVHMKCLPEWRKLPGEETWFAYDLKKRLGFLPSLWAQSFGIAGAATDDEWKWLHKGATLDEADKWLIAKLREKTPL